MIRNSLTNIQLKPSESNVPHNQLSYFSSQMFLNKVFMESSELINLNSLFYFTRFIYIYIKHI